MEKQHDLTNEGHHQRKRQFGNYDLIRRIDIGGMGAIDFYTEWKAIYVDYSDRLQKAQIDRVD